MLKNSTPFGFVENCLLDKVVDYAGLIWNDAYKQYAILTQKRSQEMILRNDKDSHILRDAQGRPIKKMLARVDCFKYFDFENCVKNTNTMQEAVNLCEKKYVSPHYDLDGVPF